MIAYNESKALEAFYKTIPKQFFDDIILVDDKSPDGTYELAERLGIDTYQNERQLGYGGNMKRALEIALGKGVDVIVDIHPDGEYLASAIEPALKKIEEGADFVLGNRFYDTKKPLESGMYAWKYLPIIILNWLARAVLRIPCHDLHQGFRVYTRNLLESVQYEGNSNDYLFSFELIAQAAFQKIVFAEVPVETRYSGEKRGASLGKSIRYSLGVFLILMYFLVAKIGIRGRLFKTPC